MDFGIFSRILNCVNLFSEISIPILLVLRLNPFGVFDRKKKTPISFSPWRGSLQFASIQIFIDCYSPVSNNLRVNAHKKGGNICYGNVNLFYRLWDDIDEGQVQRRDNGPEVMLRRRFHLRHHHL